MCVQSCMCVCLGCGGGVGGLKEYSTFVFSDIVSFPSVCVCVRVLIKVGCRR